MFCYAATQLQKSKDQKYRFLTVENLEEERGWVFCQED